MRELTLLVLLACGGEAPGTGELYRDALAAPTWHDARALCGRIPAVQRDDCLVASMDTHGRLDEHDCDAIADGVWRHECVFLYAEREARAGNLSRAFAACEATAFGRECTFHLVREGARAATDLPLAEAAVVAVPYADLPRAPDAQRLFWRTWFKERLEAKEPIDPTGCATMDCVGGAKETLYLTLTSLARAPGGTFCGGAFPDGRVGARELWRPGPLTAGWVTEFVDGACAHDPGHRRAPVPLPEAEQVRPG